MKKLLLSTLAVFFCFSAFSQFGELEELTYSTQAENMIVADIDGDSDLDIVMTDFDSKIIWRENLGAGDFGLQHTIGSTAGWMRDFCVEDLDGDGDLDIAVAEPWTDEFKWYENLGAGEFGSPQVISNARDAPWSVFAEDMDGDGDNDLICASSYDSILAWHENMGGGVFGQEHVLDSVYGSQYMIRTQDLDGDGDNDLIVAYDVDGAAIYENLGGGNFGPKQIISNTLIRIHSAKPYDFDGDGDYDLLVSSRIEEKIAWHENLGGGVFGTEQYIDTTIIAVQCISAADLDGDGDLDVMAGTGFNTEVKWYANDGTGSFGPEQPISAGTSCYEIAPMDVDSDGILDVLVGSPYSVKWYRNLGSGNFATATIIGPELVGPDANALVDLDGDGDLDVVVGGGENHIGWVDNLGNGAFDQVKYVTEEVDAVSDVAIGDMDGDGSIDVLSTSLVDSTLAWYRNLGGTFGAQIVVDSTLAFPRDVKAIDLDADGDLDIIAVAQANQQLLWYENVAGTFGAMQVIETFTYAPEDIELEDIDNDGDLDIAGIHGVDLFWIENLGTGTFAPHQVLMVFQSSVHEFEFADLNGDAHNDIVATSLWDNEVIWHQWFSNGTYSNKQIISSMMNSPTDVYAADFDNDGDLDVAACSEDSHMFAWYENTGGGAFGQMQEFNFGLSGPRSLKADDLDGDGDTDIVVVTHSRALWVPNHRYHATQISGRLFVDLNQNGMNDSTDIGINQIGVASNPASDFTYTYSTGHYIHNFSDVAGSYLIAPQTPQYWSVVTDSLDYTVIVDSTFTAMDSLDFGFYPDTIAPAIEPILTGGFPRCFSTVNYWVDVNNMGTTMPSGMIELHLDTNLTYVSADVTPDSVVGDHLYWSYDSLPYFGQQLIRVQVQMPGFWAMGTNMQSYLTASVIDTAGVNVFERVDTLDQVLVCAYDPNDKTVTPAGFGPQGYILPTVEQLDYLIRFQNTGTDTALNVVIKDQLSMHLDWQSLTPVSSSHPMQVTVDQSGEASFSFLNIMLPDSNVNELESHGYVRFTINMLPNLPLGTSIYNTANIYFDFNPAIVTNTTINTIDICFDNTPAVIEPFAEDTICYEGGAVQLPNATPAGGTYYGSGVSGSFFDPMMVGDGLHYVSYEYMDVDGCIMVDSTAVLVEICGGIEEGAENSFVLHPNPATDFVTVSFAQPINGNHTVNVVDLLGNEVRTIQVSGGTNVNIDSDDMAAGVYFLTLSEQSSGKVLHTAKLVIK